MKTFLLILFLFICVEYSSFAQTGAALNFDGVNDYISIPNNILLKPSTGITIEAWIKPTDIHTNEISEIYRKEDADARHLLSFMNFGTSLVFGLGIGGDPIEISAVIDASDYEGQWVNVAATFDGNTFRIYRNGELIKSENVSGLIDTVGTAPAIIGSLSGTDEFFIGSIDELKIWDHALTICEIQSALNCELNPITQNGLIALYHFNQGIAAGTNTTENTVLDAGGNHFDGVLNNFALTGTTSNWVSPGGTSTGTICNITNVSISITSGPNPSCSGTNHTFTAIPNNAGTDIIYQWRINNIDIIGANSNVFSSSTLYDKDTIICALTNPFICDSPFISNSIIMMVTPQKTPAVLITSNAYSAICVNDTVSFYGLVLTGGSDPTYQWTKNGTDIIGAVDSIYKTPTLINNDTIRCRISSNAACISTTSAISKPEIIKVAPVYTFTGNGNWDDPTNWDNNDMPPTVLPKCSEIIINPSINGECILNIPVIIDSGANLNILAGRKFKILGDLIVGNFTNNVIYNTTRKFGCVASTEQELQGIPYLENLDSSFLPLFNRTESLPLWKYIDVPPPGNQDTLKSCTGWAVGYGIMGAYYKKLENNTTYTDGGDKITSPAFIWNQLNYHLNDGITIASALDLVRIKGCCKWYDMPGDNTPFQASPTQVAIDNAKEYKNYRFEWYQCQIVDIDYMKWVLAGNYLIAVSIEDDEGFDSGTDNRSFIKLYGEYIYKNNHGKYLGNHAMVICGYDDNLNAFKVLNSWGPDWSNHGFTWIDYNLFKKIVIKRKDFYEPEIFVVATTRSNLGITTLPITNVTNTTATSGYTITSNPDYDFISQTGVCYYLLKNPTTSWGTNQYTVPSSTGTATMSNLLTGYTYFVRAYAKTSRGIVYGNELNFKTVTIGLTSTNISSITQTTAVSGGNITSDGGSPITARGVCWSQSPNPTITNEHSNDGTGMGSFISNIIGLSPNTTYYVKAFAINGIDTAYGNEISFTTFDLNSIIICNQKWTTQNLDVSTYRNGDIIPQVTDISQWGTLNTGAWCWYDNDSTTYGATYGRLYNWYAVNDSRGLAPHGWHIASSEEWTTLRNCLGGYQVAGGKLKEIGTTHWLYPNTDATNSSGFTGLPGGACNSIWGFQDNGGMGVWWSSSEYNISTAWFSYIFYNSGMIDITMDSNKKDGYSVRCIKD